MNPEPPRILKSVSRSHDRWALARGRGIAFSRALASGEVPPVTSGTYEAWVRTCACAVCGKPAPSEVSHLADEPFKALGSKVSSLWTWPSCRECHCQYHDSRYEFPVDPWALIALTVLRAQVEGVLRVDGSGGP